LKCVLCLSTSWERGDGRQIAVSRRRSSTDLGSNDPESEEWRETRKADLLSYGADEEC